MSGEASEPRPLSGRVGVVLLVSAFLLLVAGALGIGMANASVNSTPRVNPRTLGLAVAALSAIAFGVRVWAEPVSPTCPFWLRAVFTAALCAVGGYCAFATFILAFLVG